MIEGKISEREKSILNFIHEFGFCDIHTLIEEFRLGRSSCYTQMKLLKRLGLVNQVLALPTVAGVYYLTSKAIKLLELDLPYLSYVPLNAHRHYQTVFSVYFHLKKLYPITEWITERRLILKKKEELKNSKLHLPDAILKLSEDYQIAIEVELSLKAQKRLLEILTDYAVDATIQEVWYFCSQSVLQTVQLLSTSISKVKIHSLNEVTHYEPND